MQLRPDPEMEIDDEAIRAAFEASPQLVTPMRVAYFNVDPARDREIEEAIRSVPTVEEVYALPRLLVTGERRLDDASPYREPRELSIRRLRLLAARAQCDVLLVFDYGHRIDVEPNAWAALNVLLVPALFVPFRDANVRAYLDAYVIDTRNGYLYAHHSENRDAEVDELTLWSDADEQRAASMWSDMLATARVALADVLRAREPQGG